MKRKHTRWIACLCIMLLLITSNCLPCVGAEDSDEQLEILQSLQILDGLTDDLLGAKTVSRAEFLALVMQLFGYGAAGGEAVFSDVRPDDWAAGYITTAARLGLIAGDGEGRFRPGEEITGHAAVKILMTALGYENEARAMGGYPQGYLAAGAGAGLLKGIAISADQALSPGQAVELLFRATEVSVAVVGGMTGDEVSFTREKQRTVLTEQHRIYTDTGIVTKNGRTALAADSRLPMTRVEIDGTEYLAGKTDAPDLLGYRVRYYYHWDETRGERTLLYAAPQNNTVTDLDSEDDLQYENHQYTYDKGDGSRRARVSVSAQTDVIYNGRAAASYTAAMLTPEYGKVRLIDNNGDGRAEVAFVSDYCVAVALGVNADANEIYFKFGKETLQLDEYDQYRLTDSDGKGVGMDSLRENSVLLIMESADGQAADILISNQSVSGTVTEYEPGVGWYTIGGSRYRAGAYLTETMGKDAIAAGTSATFYLDANGRIQAMGAAQNESIQYGYLVNAGKGSQAGRLGRHLVLQVLTQAGRFAELHIAERGCDLNGAAATEEEILAAVTQKDSVQQQLIGYRLNGDGDVVMIDTAGDWRAEDDALYILHSAPSGRYKKKPNVISGLIGFTADAKVFMAPSGNSTQEKDFSVTLVSNLANDTELTAGYIAYSTDETSPLANLLVVYDQMTGASIDKQAKFAIIKSIGESLNADGDTVQSLEVFQDGKIVRYPCESADVTEEIYSYSAKIGRYELGEGDAVRLAVNSANQITRIELHYDKSAEKMILANPTGGYTGAPGFMLMNVYDKQEDMVVCTFDTPKPGMTPSADTLYYFKVPTFNVGVYDAALKDKVKAGSVADIKDYKHYGTYSRLYVSTWYGEGLSMVVYQ